MNRTSRVLSLFFLLPFFTLIGNSCSKNPCPETACECGESVCDRCFDQIASVDGQFCEEYLFDPNGYHRLIEGYHQENQTSGSAKEVLEKVDVYFDMSDGMNYKVIQAEDEAGLLTDLVNILSGETVEYFRLRADEGNEIEPFV